MTRPDADDAHSPGSFAARLKEKYGAGVDPEVSLDRESQAEPRGAPLSASSELVLRLAYHSLKESRYKLQGEIARGGMGAILKVWDEDLRRTLAMKVILGRGEAPSEGGTPAVDEQQLGRFLEEAQITGQLDHPGIAPVHELGLDGDGRVYFTMKLVKGRDLRQIFELVFAGKEGWNETRALSVVLRVCEALAFAHAKGVIHRDVKPANIMVGGFGEVYVMDWGLARVLGRADTHDLRLKPESAPSLSSVKTERRAERETAADSPLVTMDGDVVGTPAYMPPEQARGEVAELGPHSDVYAIGALLYHLLARQMPFVPPNARVSAHAVLMRVIDGPPRPLVELAPRAPAELIAIVEKAMARDVSKRYADTRALSEDLRAYLEHRVVGAYETGAWAETKKWIERNRPLAASLATAVLLLVVGLSASLVFKARADENAARADAKAADLLAANTTIEAKRAELEQKNVALDAATQTARAKEREATQKTNDVLSLSAIQDLKDLEARADELWPADPENVPKYAAWLADARVLIEGRPADPAHGIKAKASLAQHEAKLAEIRLLAKPLTAQQIDDDRRASPSYAEWEKSRAELHWKRRMLGDEPWPVEAEVETALAQEQLPADANGLNDLAWKLVDVDPAKIVYGSEIRGLILARRAVAAAQASERALFRDTLAWALVRTGRFDEARAEEERAVQEIGAAKRAEYEGYLANVQKAIAEWSSETARARQREALSQLEGRVAVLERDLDAARTYVFEDGEARWWEAQLSKLVSDLRSFTDEKSGGLYSSGVSEKHGWGIVKRADFAASVDARTLSGAEAKRRWNEACAAIAASPKYGGLKQTPQLGLLPIGADPASGLWEFWHVQSGEEPQRGADGKLILSEKMGLVLVLIPGGTFTLGAQAQDPTGTNYDRAAQADETPYEVPLDAYFLSKYEMTQGQWERFLGRNPSYFGPRNYVASWNRDGKAWNGLHPVERVSWNDCTRVLKRLGLELPTEAQWEHGCRGSTSSVYWSGDDPATLVDAGNVADQFAKANGGGGWTFHESWDDGQLAHAEVGSYRANDLGLHDTHGNVFEWCRDGYGRTTKWLAGSGERNVSGASTRVYRGGSFIHAASSGARSAYRSARPPEDQDSFLGLRPARASRLSASQLHPPRK